MEESDSHTESLRAEQGKDGDDAHPATDETPMTLGSMIRGPIGREGADDGASTRTDTADTGER